MQSATSFSHYGITFVQYQHFSPIFYQKMGHILHYHEYFESFKFLQFLKKGIYAGISMDKSQQKMRKLVIVLVTAGILSSGLCAMMASPPQDQDWSSLGAQSSSYVSAFSESTTQPTTFSYSMQPLTIASMSRRESLASSTGSLVGSSVESSTSQYGSIGQVTGYSQSYGYANTDASSAGISSYAVEAPTTTQYSASPSRPIGGYSEVDIKNNAEAMDAYTYCRNQLGSEFSKGTLVKASAQLVSGVNYLFVVQLILTDYSIIKYYARVYKPFNGEKQLSQSGYYNLATPASSSYKSIFNSKDVPYFSQVYQQVAKQLGQSSVKTIKFVSAEVCFPFYVLKLDITEKGQTTTVVVMAAYDVVQKSVSISNQTISGYTTQTVETRQLVAPTPTTAAAPTLTSTLTSSSNSYHTGTTTSAPAASVSSNSTSSVGSSSSNEYSTRSSYQYHERKGHDHKLGSRYNSTDTSSVSGAWQEIDIKQNAQALEAYSYCLSQYGRSFQAGQVVKTSTQAVKGSGNNYQYTIQFKLGNGITITYMLALFRSLSGQVSITKSQYVNLLNSTIGTYRTITNVQSVPYYEQISTQVLSQLTKGSSAPFQFYSAEVLFPFYIIKYTSQNILINVKITYNAFTNLVSIISQNSEQQSGALPKVIPTQVPAEPPIFGGATGAYQIINITDKGATCGLKSVQKKLNESFPSWKVTQVSSQTVRGINLQYKLEVVLEEGFKSHYFFVLHKQSIQHSSYYIQAASFYNLFKPADQLYKKTTDTNSPKYAEALKLVVNMHKSFLPSTPDFVEILYYLPFFSVTMKTTNQSRLLKVQFFHDSFNQSITVLNRTQLTVEVTQPMGEWVVVDLEQNERARKVYEFCKVRLGSVFANAKILKVTSRLLSGLTYEFLVQISWKDGSKVGYFAYVFQSQNYIQIMRTGYFNYKPSISMSVKHFTNQKDIEYYDQIYSLLLLNLPELGRESLEFVMADVRLFNYNITYRIKTTTTLIVKFSLTYDVVTSNITISNQTQRIEGFTLLKSIEADSQSSLGYKFIKSKLDAVFNLWRLLQASYYEDAYENTRYKYILQIDLGQGFKVKYIIVLYKPRNLAFNGKQDDFQIITSQYYELNKPIDQNYRKAINLSVPLFVEVVAQIGNIMRQSLPANHQTVLLYYYLPYFTVTFKMNATFNLRIQVVYDILKKQATILNTTKVAIPVQVKPQYQTVHVPVWIQARLFTGYGVDLTTIRYSNITPYNSNQTIGFTNVAETQADLYGIAQSIFNTLNSQIKQFDKDYKIIELKSKTNQTSLIYFIAYTILGQKSGQIITMDLPRTTIETSFTFVFEIKPILAPTPTPPPASTPTPTPTPTPSHKPSAPSPTSPSPSLSSSREVSSTKTITRTTTYISSGSSNIHSSSVEDSTAPVVTLSINTNQLKNSISGISDPSFIPYFTCALPDSIDKNFIGTVAGVLVDKIRIKRFNIILVNQIKYAIRLIVQMKDDGKLFEALFSLDSSAPQIIIWRRINEVSDVNPDIFSQFFKVQPDDQTKSLIKEVFGANEFIRPFNRIVFLEKKITFDGVYYRGIVELSNNVQYLIQFYSIPDQKFYEIMQFERLNSGYNSQKQTRLTSMPNSCKYFQSVKNYLSKSYPVVFAETDISFVAIYEEDQSIRYYRIVFTGQNGRYESITKIEIGSNIPKLPVIVRWEKLEDGYVQNQSPEMEIIKNQVTRHVKTKLNLDTTASYIQTKVVPGISVFYKVLFAAPIPFVVSLEAKSIDSGLYFKGMERVQTPPESQYYNSRVFGKFSLVTPSQLKSDQIYKTFFMLLTFQGVTDRNHQVLAAFRQKNPTNIIYKVIYKITNGKEYLGEFSLNLSNSESSIISFQPYERQVEEGDYRWKCSKINSRAKLCERCESRTILSAGRCYSKPVQCSLQLAQTCYACKDGYIRWDGACYQSPKEVQDMFRQRQLLSSSYSYESYESYAQYDQSSSASAGTSFNSLGSLDEEEDYSSSTEYEEEDYLCAQWSGSKCAKCFSGYYYSQRASRCTPIDPLCKVFDEDKEECRTCISGCSRNANRRCEKSY